MSCSLAASLPRDGLATGVPLLRALYRPHLGRNVANNTRDHSQRRHSSHIIRQIVGYIDDQGRLLLLAYVLTSYSIQIKAPARLSIMASQDTVTVTEELQRYYKKAREIIKPVLESTVAKDETKQSRAQTGHEESEDLFDEDADFGGDDDWMNVVESEGVPTV